jgi:hypothetical protein
MYRKIYTILLDLNSAGSERDEEKQRKGEKRDGGKKRRRFRRMPQTRYKRQEKTGNEKYAGNTPRSYVN